MTTSSGKHLGDISPAHVVSLMCKALTSSKESDDPSIGFDLDRIWRQQELTNNKNQKGNYHVRIMLKDVFGFPEHEEKAAYGLGFQLTLTRSSVNAVLNKDNATNICKKEN